MMNGETGSARALGGRLLWFVGGDRQMIPTQAFDIAADRVLGHGARFFQRVAFSNQTGKGRACHDESALFGGLEQDCVTVLDHESDSSSIIHGVRLKLP